jgi:hypothetical protein
MKIGPLEGVAHFISELHNNLELRKVVRLCFSIEDKQVLGSFDDLCIRKLCRKRFLQTGVLATYLLKSDEGIR